MIIGSVDKDDISFVQSLAGRVDIFIRLANEPITEPEEEKREDENMINLEINEYTLKATLADNSSTDALREVLKNGSITVNMSDYGGMEKVGSLGMHLPTNHEQITTEAGDIILYQGDMLVIYYAPNSWEFTKLGKILNTSADELVDILGTGDVQITLSLYQ